MSALHSPKHIGIIMDGNRRFAKRLMKTPWKGHEWGARKVESVLEWCFELDIRMLTLYSFSIENMNRPKQEFDLLMDLFEKEFSSAADNPKIHENKVRINVIGRTEMLPEKVQKAIRKAVEATKNYKDYVVNFAVAYGGRQEIVDATKKIAEDVRDGKLSPEQVDEHAFSEHLYLPDMPDPELIIRTSGERRTSGFLPWQSTYSELYFCDKLWPDFEKEDLVKAIDDFNARQRRFGE